MYLKKLSANKESFHDLILSSNGINIILGSRSVEDKKKNDTVNGVGKTLSIKLIDYCLGCRSDAHKELKKLQRNASDSGQRMQIAYCRIS